MHMYNYSNYTCSDQNLMHSDNNYFRKETSAQNVKTYLWLYMHLSHIFIFDIVHYRETSLHRTDVGEIEGRKVMQEKRVPCI